MFRRLFREPRQLSSGLRPPARSVYVWEIEHLRSGCCPAIPASDRESARSFSLRLQPAITAATYLTVETKSCRRRLSIAELKVSFSGRLSGQHFAEPVLSVRCPRSYWSP